MIHFVDYTIPIYWLKKAKEGIIEVDNQETMIGISLFFPMRREMASHEFFAFDKEDYDVLITLFEKKLLPEKLKQLADMKQSMDYLNSDILKLEKEIKQLANS